MMLSRFALATGLLAVACAAGAQTAARKTYIVQLADAPAATYAGSIRGLAATRPAAGAKLDITAQNVRAYRGFLDAQRNNVLARVGNVSVMHRYDVAFNGFSAQLTLAEAKRLQTSTAVLSVTESEVRKMDTTRTPAFLGLSTPGGLWSQLDAQARLVKGEDVIIGVIDSGAWPEDPSFGDKQAANGKPVNYSQAGTLVYGAPPLKWKGTCQTGEGFTAAMCNNKLLGARFYLSGFNAGGGTLTSFEYRSPRSGGGSGGHGTHTASTAGGNSNVDVSIDGAAVGVMSGIAPRARLAAYKVCWEATTVAATGCYTADTLKAIDDAVADGVDVINFSVSGTQTSFTDPVEIAYLNASAAGVFVAASAGNAGPANTVAHISPWLMTVAASTHDRSPVADLTLGNGSVYTGASVALAAVPNKAMVLSSAIAASGVAVADANLCFLNSLDPALAAGKIVVCDRGTNARVEKSAEVLRAGGVGMVLINPTNNSLVADYHSVPTVHLQNTARTAVRTYVAAGGATGSIGLSYNAVGVIAPQMASFSSRGPNKANGNILKPDITGPGVDIIAGWVDNSLTQAQHDALVLNNFTPQANGNSISGTSMSSPHVAGAAALLKQAHPTWTPAAIKSALMTATNDVKLADGTLDLDRWGYGAGHLAPTPASNPGLVYDAAPADYGRFLCGQALTPPAGIGSCATLGSIEAWNLNLASLTAAEVPGTLTLTRRVTNVSAASSTYVASTNLPGWNVTVTPASLTLAAGASANFTVALERTTATAGAWTFGSLNWNDGVHTVRSPLTARGVLLAAPAQVDYTGSSPTTKSFNVTPGISGAIRVQATGLVPATLSPGNVAQGVRQCFNVVVPAGAKYARFQTRNADTQGGANTDIDLTVFNGPGGTGTSVGSSGGATSDEVVSLTAPAAGTYSACVDGFATPAGGAAFTLSSWVIGPAVGAQTLAATGPRSVVAGQVTPILVRWSVAALGRYLGFLKFVDPAAVPIGETVVYVDNSALPGN